jgi:hypothetical protein
MLDKMQLQVMQGDKKMTDNLTSSDIGRLEAWVNTGKPKTKEELDKKIKGNKQFPKTLKDFLIARMEPNLPHARARKQAEEYATFKGFKLDDKLKVTEFSWKSKSSPELFKSVAIRNLKGQFQGWFKMDKKFKLP